MVTNAYTFCKIMCNKRKSQTLCCFSTARQVAMGFILLYCQILCLYSHLIIGNYYRSESSRAPQILHTHPGKCTSHSTHSWITE